MLKEIIIDDEDEYVFKKESILKTMFQTLWFAWIMAREIKANEHKGHWREWKNQKQQIKELRWHTDKLQGAMEEGNQELIDEYCADIANIAFFSFVNNRDSS